MAAAGVCAGGEWFFGGELFNRESPGLVTLVGGVNCGGDGVDQCTLLKKKCVFSAVGRQKKTGPKKWSEIWTIDHFQPPSESL